MAIVFDSVDIRGLRAAHFSQLLFYLNQHKRSGEYYGNKKQFIKRQDELETWLSDILDYSVKEGIIIPKR